MSEEHNERPVFEGRDRRQNDRRATFRRKSDQTKIWLRYLAVAVVTAILLKLFHFL